VDGGVRVLEVTLRTPVALQCMEAIGGGARRHRRRRHGAQRRRCAGRENAGCQFAVSPGYTTRSAQACREIGLPLLPGVSTGSEVMQANADGYFFLKLFPAMRRRHPDAEGAGRAVHRRVFCPTGGITVETAPQFLALPNVKVCGGSWLTPSRRRRPKDWARITP
jgi:2-dehydro-3-deoxyphosphogluconate aldolase/(4S)-4-hydroxy-2-oxoglutarate aldolase